MRHYNFLSKEEMKEVFYRLPNNFNNNTPKELLRYALGSLLYMPGNKDNIADMIIDQKYNEVTSVAWCLEDALTDSDLLQGENNVLEQLTNIGENLGNGNLDYDNVPLIFIRVRDVQQLGRLLDRISKDDLSIAQGLGYKCLTGFIFPKFNSKTSLDYLNTLNSFNNKTHGFFYYCMPIIESIEIMYKENRINELLKLQKDLTTDTYTDMVLNVRVGATDFSSIYGLRRSIDNTIYDISLVRDVLCDILNVFGRKNHFTISGPVWEYFDNTNRHRILKPTLRETPFRELLKDRQGIINTAVDGLIREVLLDKANGFCGKTTIHPSHVKYINALHVVTEEEYLDAKAILDSDGSGVMKGINGNKMNEVKPHTNWANQIMAKAHIYGVIKGDKHYANLF